MHAVPGTPKPPAPDLNEAAAAGRREDVTAGLVNGLRLSSDRILKMKGGRLDVYEKVYEDDQVFSTFQQRTRAVISRPWRVEPGGERPIDIEAAEDLQAQLEAIGWNGKTRMMLSGLFYGYSTAEMIWAMIDGKVRIHDIRVRQQKRFGFNQDMQLVLKKAGKPDGELMPERKFWTFQTGADHDDEPYGLGLGHWLYWPVWFKKNDIKFWLTLIDKFGVPTAKGTYPKGASQGDIDKLLQALVAIQSEAAIVTPEGMLIDLVEAARQGSAGQQELYDRMDAAIAKVVLSQTMTTDNGSSQSQAVVHLDVRQDVTESDSEILNDSFNCGPALWLTEWNFPGAAAPRVIRDFQEEEDKNELAERDQKLWGMGWRPTQEYAEDKYPGWQISETAEQMTVRQAKEATEGNPDDHTENPDDPEVSFAEVADPDSIQLLVAQILEQDNWPDVVEEIIGPIEDLLNESEGFDDFAERLAEKLAAMKTDKIVEAMARALFVSRVAGDLDIDITA